MESRNFEIRKYVLQYDNVMNKQREVIYEQRRKVLFGEDLKDYIMEMMEELIHNIVVPIIVMAASIAEEWDFELLNKEPARDCTDRFDRHEVFDEEELQRLDAEKLEADVCYEDFADLYDEPKKRKSARAQAERSRADDPAPCRR